MLEEGEESWRHPLFSAMGPVCTNGSQAAGRRVTLVAETWSCVHQVLIFLPWEAHTSQSSEVRGDNVVSFGKGNEIGSAVCSVQTEAL